MMIRAKFKPMKYVNLIVVLALLWSKVQQVPKCQVMFSPIFFDFDDHRRRFVVACVAGPSDRRRLSLALRFILLIMAGDVELNPGPSAVLCQHCNEDCGSENVQCCVCLEVAHYSCTGVPVSYLKVPLRQKNIEFVCTPCLEDRKLEKYRWFLKQLASRCITFRTLLDVFDRQFGKAPSTANTGVQCNLNSMSTPQRQQAAATEPLALVPAEQSQAQRVEQASDPTIVKGKEEPLSNFYGFNFFYNGLRFRSLEHAYQCLKATRLDMRVLADRIRLAPTPLMAKRFASALPRIPQSELYDLMKELLLAKAEQCYSFRKKLRATTGAIYHSTYRNVDTYWCTGLNYWDIPNHRRGSFQGMNMLGRLLEEVRERLKPEEEYHKDVEVRVVDGTCYILYDGEDLLLPRNMRRVREGRKQGFQGRGRRQ
jgi:ribA/ribD-fused uncharacterized protein